MSIGKIAYCTIVAILLVILSYAALIIYFVWPISLSNFDKAGVFGDSFGVLTSLFSGLAFAGIIITILLQRDELKLQREELSDTREELKLSRQEMESSNKTLRKQNFETTLFNMLKAHQDIKENVVFQSGSQHKGLEALHQIAHKLLFNNRPDKQGNNSGPIYIVQFDNELLHYIKHLLSIMNFIDRSEPEVDTSFYMELIESQLSVAELKLLFFYGLIHPRFKGPLKPLIEKYKLLKNLDEKSIKRGDDAQISFKDYNSSAFCV